MGSTTPINFGIDSLAADGTSGLFTIRASSGSDTASGANVTIGGLAASTSLDVSVNGVSQGSVSSNAGGQITLALDLDTLQTVNVGNVIISGIAPVMKTVDGITGIEITPHPLVVNSRIVLHNRYGQQVTAGLYGTDGQLVKMMHDGYLAPGKKAFTWTTDITPGMYLLRVNGVTKKILVSE